MDSVRAEEIEGKFEAKYQADGVYPELSINQFAFGSCHKPTKVDNKEFWQLMINQRPQVILLLGDQHYINSNDPSRHVAAFQKLEQIPGYVKLRNSVPSFAIWDNHDYGKGYPGKNHPHAAKVEQIFLDSNRVSENDIRRTREGIYGAWIFGKKPNRVQFILLDTHRQRSELPGVNRAFGIDDKPTARMIGNQQWDWLDTQLKLEAEVRIIGSPVQVLSNQHPWRRWGVFPHERTRLLNMAQSAKGTVVFLTGDRHHGEISRSAQKGEKPICDITASGWAQMYDNQENNDLRIKGTTDKNHFGWIQIDWQSRELTMQLLSTQDSTVLLEHVEKLIP